MEFFLLFPFFLLAKDGKGGSHLDWKACGWRQLSVMRGGCWKVKCFGVNFFSVAAIFFHYVKLCPALTTFFPHSHEISTRFVYASLNS